MVRRRAVDVGRLLPMDTQQRVERVAAIPNVCFQPPVGKVEEAFLRRDLAGVVEPLNSETEDPDGVLVVLEKVRVE